MDADLQKILNAVNGVQTTVNGLQTTVNGLQTTVNGLQTTVAELNERVSTQEQVGVLYEINARQEIARRFGQPYAESFTIRDLHGLVNVAFPKDATLGSDGKLKVHEE
jgi:hypothetical protein